MKKIILFVLIGILLFLLISLMILDAHSKKPQGVPSLPTATVNVSSATQGQTQAPEESAQVQADPTETVGATSQSPTENTGDKPTERPTTESTDAATTAPTEETTADRVEPSTQPPEEETTQPTVQAPDKGRLDADGYYDYVVKP